MQATVKRNDIDKILGQVIREIRLSKNLSQEKLAEIGGFERSYISKVETGAPSIPFCDCGGKVSISTRYEA